MAVPFSPISHLLLLLALVVTNQTLIAAQTYHNITSGSTLTSSLISPSGDFAFGFQPLPSDPTNFLLAVWFDKTTNKTVVWYATDNNHNAVLCQRGFSVQLTTDGQLSLKDGNNQEAWNAGASSASYAALLDTGNLVLASSDGTPQWQSFNYPTDTILPSQTLELQSELRSHLMGDDYSNGRFKLSMQSDGNLVFYYQSILTGTQYGQYWASNTVGKGLRLVFNESGSIYLPLNDTTQFGVTSAGASPVRGLYQRGTLDPDGVFRHYIRPKNDSNGQGWTVVDLKPSDICFSQATDTRSGICGFNSYCKSDGNGNNQTVDCLCPPSYSFFDPTRKYNGCKPNFPAQSCDADESALFKLVPVPSLDWPRADYEMNAGRNEDQCKSDCLSDCFCAVAIFNDGSCWKKKFPLSNGKMGNEVVRVAFVKVRTGNAAAATSTVEKRVSSVPKAWIAAGSSVLGTSVLINVILVAAVLLLTTCASKKIMHTLRPDGAEVGLTLRCFTYKELEEASNGFCEEVGSGAFGRVYKGYLHSESSLCVAIKRLEKLEPDTEKEFGNEIRSIGQTHHKNLARLLGFCNEGRERMLVYEFMSNGSLLSFLFSDERPDWNRRIHIAKGIAKGLLYLHEECATPIVHCDIKLQNILMDDNLAARISDFGMAKMLRAGQTQTLTGIRGTRGYVAPEWFKASTITAKVDVYSFGVMLLEIICRRRNVEHAVTEEDEANTLTFWAYDCYSDGRLELLVEGDEEALADLRMVERFVAVAIWCIQEDPSLRPSMAKVTQMLDGLIPIPAPPEPSCSTNSFHRALSID